MGGAGPPFSDVQTVFSNYGCTGCHGGSGGIDLGSYDGVIAGGNHGAAIVIGDSASSNLYLKMTDAAPFGSQMPTNGSGPVTAEDLAIVAAWIDGGAADTCP